MMARDYTREQYLERIAWIEGGEADDQHDDGHDCGISGRDGGGFRARRWTLLEEVQYDGVFAFKYSPRPNTPAIRCRIRFRMRRSRSGCRSLLDRQREIQRVNYDKHMGQILEATVEGHNQQRGQVVGRTTQNKTLNFTTASPLRRRREVMCRCV